jgi:hypothetical protein
VLGGKMNIALIIGVSEYNNVHHLPACVSDVKLIREILEATSKYEEILSISENTLSAQVKNKISSWIKAYQNTDIDEVFFYFTGHGEFSNNEFFYLLTDYDAAKKNQTSLSNSEIDDWLRSLKAEITFKVVDACHSGISYVKEGKEALKSYLQKSINQFQKCYFMFSSRQNQSSWQDDKLSHFTRSFAEAILKHSAENIRYRDIADFISDEFSGNSQQTPFFVIQADNTEHFTTILPEMKYILVADDLIKTTEEEKLLEEGTPTHKLSLKELVENDALNYISEEAVLDLLEKLRIALEEYQHQKELIELYDVELTFLDSLVGVANLRAIGEWVAENKSRFFAEPTYAKEAYYEEVPDSRKLSLASWDELPLRKVRKYRDVINAFRSTVELPYVAVKMQAQPKFPNIDLHILFITFTISMTHIHFFYLLSRYKTKNWDEYQLVENSKWQQTSDITLADAKNVINAVAEYLAGFETQILVQIREKFGDTTNDDPQQ